MKCIIVIAGASGEIGTAFVRKFVNRFPVIGISRTSKSREIHKNLSWIHVDLTKPIEVEKAFSDLDFSAYEKVILLHNVGLDKFENVNFPLIEPLRTIDEKVYDSNVNTYKYIASLFISKIEKERVRGSKTELVLSSLAGVADKHGMIFLTSFVESKNIVRMYMQNATREFPWVSALVINVTSTVTKSALLVRPYAKIDSTWLLPQEVAEEAVPKLLRKKKGYSEVDIIKHDPHFDDYYKSNKRMFKKWSREVWGPKGKPKRSALS